MSYYGQPQPAPLPPECWQHAANLARWFPEVLLTLGAADLQGAYAPTSFQVVDDAGGRTLEIVLECPAVAAPTGAAAASRYVGGHSDIASTVAGFSSLAKEYEKLAASSPSSRTAPGGNLGVLSRLESAADKLLTFSQELSTFHAVFPQAAPPSTGAAEVPAYAPSALPSASCSDSPSSLGVRPSIQRTVSCPAPASPIFTVATPSGNQAERPTCPQPAFFPDSSAIKEDHTPISPGSGTRGGHQGRQGRQSLAGRSRTTAPKTLEFRNQRDLVIHNNKIPQLSEEPSSPKFHTSTKAWGTSKKKPGPRSCSPMAKSDEDLEVALRKRGSSEELSEEANSRRSSKGEAFQLVGEDRSNSPPIPNFADDRSAASIKERIDKKLSLMFGGKVDPLNRYASAPD